jgi:hypothetical protein
LSVLVLALLAAVAVVFVPVASTGAATVKLKVTWNANGGKIGTAKSKSVKIKKGKKLGKLPTAKRAKYKLNGWWTKKKGGKKVTKSTKVTKKVTFYAHWKKAATSSTTPTSSGSGAATPSPNGTAEPGIGTADPGVTTPPAETPPVPETTPEPEPAAPTPLYTAGSRVKASCDSAFRVTTVTGQGMLQNTGVVGFQGPVTCTGDFDGSFTVLPEGASASCLWSGNKNTSAPNFFYILQSVGCDQDDGIMFGLTSSRYSSSGSFDAAFTTDRDLFAPPTS